MENKPLFRYKTIPELIEEFGIDYFREMSISERIRAGNEIASKYNSIVLNAFLHNKPRVEFMLDPFYFTWATLNTIKLI